MKDFFTCIFIYAFYFLLFDFYFCFLKVYKFFLFFTIMKFVKESFLNNKGIKKIKFFDFLIE